MTHSLTYPTCACTFLQTFIYSKIIFDIVYCCYKSFKNMLVFDTNLLIKAAKPFPWSSDRTFMTSSILGYCEVMNHRWALVTSYPIICSLLLLMQGRIFNHHHIWDTYHKFFPSTVSIYMYTVCVINWTIGRISLFLLPVCHLNTLNEQFQYYHGQ